MSEHAVNVLPQFSCYHGSMEQKICRGERSLGSFPHSYLASFYTQLLKAFYSFMSLTCIHHCCQGEQQESWSHRAQIRQPLRHSLCLFKVNAWIRERIRSYRWSWGAGRAGKPWKTKRSAGTRWALHGGRDELVGLKKGSGDHTVTKATEKPAGQMYSTTRFYLAHTSGPMLPSSPGVPAFPGGPCGRQTLQSYTIMYRTVIHSIVYTAHTGHNIVLRSSTRWL